VAVSFVAAGTPWESTTSSTAYTLDAPAGIADGDLLIAFQSRNTGASGNGTTPSGWTLIRTMYSGTAGEATMQVFTKVWHTGDATTWTDGLAPAASSRKQTVVMAYRGAKDTLLVEDGTTDTVNTTAFSSPTVNNTNPVGWRVGAISSRIASSGGTSTVTSNTERVDNATATSTENDLAVCDSNGTISTGNTSIAWTVATSAVNACTWIGIIVPADTRADAGTGTETVTSNAAKVGHGAQATEYFRRE
jgi:hypothetical protein